MEILDKKMKTCKFDMALHGLDSTLSNLKKRIMLRSLKRIEESTRREEVKKLACIRLHTFQMRRVRAGFQTLKLNSSDFLQARDHICQAAFILFQFFHIRQLKNKGLFFKASKHVMETVERKSVLFNNARARMVKSNSIILEASKNIMSGLLELDQIVYRKRENYFR